MINNIITITLISSFLIFIPSLILNYIVLIIAVSKNIPEDKTNKFFIINGLLINVTFVFIVLCLFFLVIKFFI